MQLIEQGMRRIAKGVADGFGAEAEVDFRVIFAPLINAEAETDVLADAAAAVVGEANVDRAKPPSMGSEDFSFMMEKVPGAYIQVGNGDSAGAAQSGLQLQRRGHALRRGAAGDRGGAAAGAIGRARLPGAGAAPGNASGSNRGWRCSGPLGLLDHKEHGGMEAAFPVIVGHRRAVPIATGIANAVVDGTTGPSRATGGPRDRPCGLWRWPVWRSWTLQTARQPE